MEGYLKRGNKTSVYAIFGVLPYKQMYLLCPVKTIAAKPTDSNATVVDISIFQIYPLLDGQKFLWRITSVGASMGTAHTYATACTAGVNSSYVLLFHHHFLICKTQCLQIMFYLFASFTARNCPPKQVKMPILFMITVYF